jgi:hypothetical protein
MIINDKEVTVTCFKVSVHSPGKTKENCKNSQSEQIVTKPRSELSTMQTQVKSITDSPIHSFSFVIYQKSHKMQIKLLKLLEKGNSMA